MMQTGFIVIDEHRCGDMHGITQNKPFGNTAGVQAFLYLRRNVDKRPTGRDIKPEFFAVTFHDALLAF
jgi:hypothetical protein